MRHEVNFGSNAAWINSKNIKELKAFISKASKNLIVEKIVIKGFSTPSKVQLNKLDVIRAKAVAKLLKKEGINYPVVVFGQGSAPSKKGDAGRSAVVTVLGKPKKQIEQL
jgi:outer membrane protein OmpA-like peptidoglycan-associated protein